MPVRPDEVRQIAELARLRLSEADCGRLTQELNRILDHVSALGEADPEGGQAQVVGPPAAPRRRSGTLAPDPLTRPPSAFAPDWRNGLFVVPRLPALGGPETSEEEPDARS